MADLDQAAVPTVSAEGETTVRQRWAIEWQITGKTDVIATSKEDAERQFQAMSAGRLIADGYDDMTNDDPVLKDAR